MAADLSIIIKAVDQASGTINGVQRELGGLEKGAGKLGGILKGGLMVGAGAAIAGIGALGAVLATSVDAASEAEDIGAQLNAVLKSTGGVAGVTADAINDHALALSEVTRFEDDAIVSAQSLLLTFTKVGKDVFPDATEATLDMAQAMKMDLKSASMLVGKALNDPIKGMTALTRSGIQFTEQQKETIAAMVEMGDTVGAQRIILAELETQLGGSAEAAGKTMAGQMDILKNSIGNVKEEIGGALIPILGNLIGWIGPKMVTGLGKFSDWFRTSVTDIQSFITKAGKAKDIIGGIVQDVTAGKPIAWQDLMNIAQLFTNQLDVQRAFGNIVKDIEAGILRIKGAFETGGVWGAVSEIGKMIGEEFAKIDWGAMWQKIGDWWTTDAVPFATTLAGNVSAWWTGTFLPALSKIDWQSMGAAMQSAWNTLATFWQTDAVPFALQVAENINQWFIGQVIPSLQRQAPKWGEELGKILKSTITINGMMLGNDANLAYTLGAGYVKLLGESLKALSIGPQMVYAMFKSIDWASAFSGGNLGDVFGNIFGPIGDFLKGAFDAVLNAVGGEILGEIQAWWNGILSEIARITSGGGKPHDPSGYVPPPNQPHSALPVSQPGRMRGADAGGFNFQITINAPGGNPQAVAVAAQQGVMAAARSMGLA
jgi:hypothetical protein